jgi:hypothetical protein
MADSYQISPLGYEFQNYQGNDTGLITTFEINSFLNNSNYIEFYIYDLNNDLVSSTLNFKDYKVFNDPTTSEGISQITLNPGDDIENKLSNQGSYVAYYNFLTKRIGDPNTNLFIDEISSDRTEIRLNSTSLSSLDIVEQTNNFINFRELSNYFVDFYLNFGDNDLVIANNIKLDNENTNNPTIVIKLYEALPSIFDIKDLAWIVTNINEPEAYRVDFPVESFQTRDKISMAGPNFNIPIKNQVNNSSENLSSNDIIKGALTSSFNQVQNLISSSNININVDYSDYSNFIHFSSVKTRLENFQYKLGLLESYSSSLNNLSGVSSSAFSQTILDKKITKVISNFDNFEYFLYYTSGSKSWPKTNFSPPYNLAKINSPSALTWYGSVDETNSNYGGQLLSASTFDNANPDQLLKSIPEYLREDPENKPYELFVDMVAQYYDNIWLYTKDITQKYNADNRLDFGISKDLVADAIRDFGLKLYQNNFSNKELYTAFLGLTPGGSLFPFPEITESLPAPTGFEFVDTLISASSDVISMDDTNKSLYKRIYHNIPYLLKSKGTLAGLRALITSYGIPDTILKISEFGGKDQVNANDWDLYFNNFNYTYTTDGNNYISTPWEINPNFQIRPEKSPGTIEFRFKTTGLPNSRVSQSLWATGNNKALVLEYTGSYLASGSYKGSIPNPYNKYGTLKYISNPGTANEISCSIYLPFFDGDWWSVMIRNNGFSNPADYIITEPNSFDFIISEDGKYIVKEASTDSSSENLKNINLYAANKIYKGNNGTSIGYIASASLDNSSVSGSWITGSTSTFGRNISSLPTYSTFSGSIQEIRYYNVALGTTSFKDYVMNPLSFEGNGVNTSPNQLVFRAALGSELDITTTSSIHPKVTGSWTPIPSFVSSSNYSFVSTPTYIKNIETFFLDQPAVGIKNRTTDKIRNENSTIPSGNILSPIRSLSQTVEASASYTDNINYLEVAFSPQNQINDDIIGQMGHFNIGDYIGDPRQRFSGSLYPDLNSLSEDYFKKYIKPYDLVDFVRLIKFFDNSLFKMIKDFTPARTSLASGLVIKQHLLERNKYSQPSISFQNQIYTGSIDMYQISGGAGGVFNPFNDINTSPYGVSGTGPNNRYFITQSYNITTPSLSGSITKLHDSQDEFYNGELSGSLIVATNGELNEANSFKIENVNYNLDYELRLYWESDIRYQRSNANPSFQYKISPEDLFLITPNSPKGGYIQVWGAGDRNGGSVPGSMRPKWVKISKFDKNGKDISLALSQLTKIIIEGKNLLGFSPSILTNTLTLKPTLAFNYNDYFVYEVINFSNNGWKPGGANGIPFASQVYLKEGYNFTGSISTSSIDLTKPDVSGFFNVGLNYSQFNKIPILPPLKDSSKGYSPVSQTYTLPTINQVPLKFILSGSIIANGTSGGGLNASSSLFIFWDKQLRWTAFNPGGAFGNSIIQEGYSQYVNTSSPLLNASVNFAPNSTSSVYLELELGPYGDITPTQSLIFNPPIPGSQIIPIIKRGPREAYLYGTADTTNVYFTPDTKFFISSSEGQTNTPYSFSGDPSQSFLETIISPFLNEKFSNSDYNVLAGEVEDSRTNKFLQDLDYQTSQTKPVNFSTILAGSALKATVPKSYYTSKAQINNRYLGSKNQSSNFNIYNPLAGTSSFGNPINIGTYGQLPSVDSVDTIIYEFEWGGGTNPEIQGGGGVKMGNLLQINSPDSVTPIDPNLNKNEILVGFKLPIAVSSSEWGRNSTISQSVSNYYYVLNGNNTPGKEISFNSYTNITNTQAVLPVTSKVITSEFGVPLKSSFMITSSGEQKGTIGVQKYNGASVRSFLNTGIPTTASFIRLFDNRKISIANSNYSPGTAVFPTVLISGSDISSSNQITPINEDLNNGERWFATLYNNLENGFNSDTIVPFKANNTILGKKGVVEILGVAQDSPTSGTPNDIYLLIKNNLSATLSSSANFTSSAIPQGTNLIVSGSGLNGVTYTGFGPGEANTTGSFTNVSTTLVTTPGSGIGMTLDVSVMQLTSLDIGSHLFRTTPAGGLTGATSLTGNVFEFTLSDYMTQSGPGTGAKGRLVSVNYPGAGDINTLSISATGSGYDETTTFTITGTQLNASPMDFGGTVTGTATWKVNIGNLNKALNSVSITSPNDVNSTYSKGSTIRVLNGAIGGGTFNLDITLPAQLFVPTDDAFSYKLGGGDGLGILMWKARAAGDNEFVLVEDLITGGVSNGAFTQIHVADYITENFEKITKEYGSNTT